jgi:hypothetical protein
VLKDFFAQAQELRVVVIALIGFTIIALTMVSLAWTTVRARRILRKGLGRDLRSGEETSLRSWMQVSNESLNDANREMGEIANSPLERLLRLLGTPRRPES